MDMVKRAFLRACINHGCLDNQKIEQILAPLCVHHQVAKPANKEALHKFVENIGDNIRDLGQSLTFVNHPISGKEYLVFAITDASSYKQSHPDLTAEECLYFSNLLDKLAKQEDHHIAWNEAYSDLDFEDSAKPPQKLRMQTLLQLWTEMGYFLEAEDVIYLGPRSIVEFEFYLRSSFLNTIKDCVLCKQLVLWDVKCSDCGTKIHRLCIRNYLRTRSKCPACDNMWSTRLSM